MKLSKHQQTIIRHMAAGAYLSTAGYNSYYIGKPLVTVTKHQILGMVDKGLLFLHRPPFGRSEWQPTSEGLEAAGVPCQPEASAS